MRVPYLDYIKGINIMYKKMGKAFIASAAIIVMGVAIAANPFVLPKSGSHYSVLLVENVRAKCEEQGEVGTSLRYLCRSSVVLVNLLPFDGVVFEEHSLRSEKLVRRCRVTSSRRGKSRVRCKRK